MGNPEYSTNGTMEPTLMTGGNYIKEGKDSTKSTCLIFSPYEQDEVGALAKALKVFENNRINLLHIESRLSKRFPEGYEFMVECDPTSGDMNKGIEQLREISSYFNIITRNYKDNVGEY
ncbi:hypothetical protein J437_LFUL004044 [Ladona fulva]|uniref:ACT domain-containing protein n=1 Tax=Ladona fulva TaxID=123851 RepID=A0A8K0JWY7_LADFU|nr:hypothetical protein J437_LFUL004044 [Ladona fulva]